ncbi:MAG: ABC transporter ATP-binding protein [Clostridium sp.]|nr:ABC transporter ATP-binding protein [Clostridium sp.]
MIKLENLSKAVCIYKGENVEILKKINFEVDSGDFVAIMGRSGAGKTTLLNIIGLLDTYDSGKYYIDGQYINPRNMKKNAHIRGCNIGYIMQNFSLIEEYSVYENIILPIDFGKEKYKKSDKTEMIYETLEKVGMSDRKKQKCRRLSGGEKQRVAIARAIVNNPDIILADEPTGSLDEKNGKEIMEILAKLNEDGKTIIIVTHDNDVAAYANRIVHIRDGMLVDGKSYN